MITRDLAERLDRAGVRWQPVPGDRFVLRSPEMGGEVFTVSDMVVEARHYPTGTLLAFNGTTEWALDSVQLEQALWLPREDQLRGLLGGAFRSLRREDRDAYEVVTLIPGSEERTFSASSAEGAYAEAVLALVAAARV